MQGQDFMEHLLALPNKSLHLAAPPHTVDWNLIPGRVLETMILGEPQDLLVAWQTNYGVIGIMRV